MREKCGVNLEAHEINRKGGKTEGNGRKDGTKHWYIDEKKRME